MFSELPIFARVVGIVLYSATMIAGVQQALAEEFALRGLGTTSCAEFAQLYREQPDLTEQQFYDWATGFMSGWNLALLSTGQAMRDLDSVPPATQEVMLRTFCDQHPLLFYYEGVELILSSFPPMPILRTAPQTSN